MKNIYAVGFMLFIITCFELQKHNVAFNEHKPEIIIKDTTKIGPLK